ncbi:retrovirus-related pol polyprotein from transposon TNT 1-94 [Tanacetum coccineum]
MSFIRMVENQNDVKIKQIRTDNGAEFRNHELESFCDEKRISQNFSSPYTPKQNGVAERKNKTLIEAARTMLNGSILSKYFWTKAVRIACYTQNRSIIDIPLSQKLSVFNTRRQQVEETYHVIFNESIEAIKFTNTSVDEIGIDDSSRNNTEVSGSITESLVPDVPQSHISNQASTSSHPVSQDRWSRDQHIKLMDIIGDLGEVMLTRSMAAKLTVASASECLFADFLSEI